MIIDSYKFAAANNWTVGNSVSRSDSGTTSAIDTTGMDLLIAAIVGYAGIGTVSDSKGNTWNYLTIYGTNYQIRIAYAKNPTVGTNHTFTLGAAGAFPSISIATFAGADLASPFDQENGNGDSTGATISTNSITPGTDGQLIIAITGHDNAIVSSINQDLSIVISQPYVGGTSLGSSIAYKAQSAAAAINPQWTFNASVIGSAAIASFKPV
jgi:hypothetical protein